MDKQILVVDCGSTGIRSLVFDSNGKVISRHYKRIEVSHPEKGATENSPNDLWDAFKNVTKKALTSPFAKIETIGITNQRSTFALWDKETGVPLTNFINWQDVRSQETAKKMNKHPLWVLLRIFSLFVGRLINNPLLRVTSMLTLTTDHTICKLKWVFDNNPELLEKAKKKELLFGTIDSWLIYKITGGEKHLTDYTNASATTLFNPFLLSWNGIFCSIFKIPLSIFPKVLDTNALFATTNKEDFGKEIPINCLCGDQMASLFGHRAYDVGDAKVSLGSGAFISMNVGSKPKFSKRGLFPLIAWKTNKKPTYMLEGQVATVGTFFDWSIEKAKLFNSVKELDTLALEATDDGGVICIPTLTGIRFPYFIPNQTASLFGLNLTTKKENIANAIIYGIAHRITDIIEGMERDTKITIQSISIDGGASNSHVLLQAISNLTQKDVYKSSENDLTSLGAAYLAGISAGIYNNEKEIKRFYVPQTKFLPNISSTEAKDKRDKWKSSLKKLLNI